MTSEEQNIEKAAIEFANNYKQYFHSLIAEQLTAIFIEVFKDSAKSQAAKEYHTKGMYTEEEVKTLLLSFGEIMEQSVRLHDYTKRRVLEWFDEHKKK